MHNTYEVPLKCLFQKCDFILFFYPHFLRLFAFAQAFLKVISCIISRQHCCVTDITYIQILVKFSHKNDLANFRQQNDLVRLQKIKT